MLLIVRKKDLRVLAANRTCPPSDVGRPVKRTPDYARRYPSIDSFGRGFDSRHLHLMSLCQVPRGSIYYPPAVQWFYLGMKNIPAKNNNRIVQAWKACQDWITDFSGSAVQAYYTEVRLERLPNAISSLITQTRDFRVSVYTKNEERPADFIAPEAVFANILRLEQGEVEGISLDFTAPFPSFDLDFHLIIYPLGNHAFELELVWWTDRVFTDESDQSGDTYQRFETLVSFLIDLQNAFQSPHLLMGPEIYEHPGPETESWIEV